MILSSDYLSFYRTTLTPAWFRRDRPDAAHRRVRGEHDPPDRKSDFGQWVDQDFGLTSAEPRSIRVRGSRVSIASEPAASA